MRSLGRLFTRWSRFAGRASRREFWFPVLTFLILSTLLQLVRNVMVTPGSGDTGAHVLDLIVTVTGSFLLIPVLSLTWRRLHDAGSPGRGHCCCSSRSAFRWS